MNEITHLGSLVAGLLCSFSFLFLTSKSNHDSKTFASQVNDAALS